MTAPSPITSAEVRARARVSWKDRRQARIARECSVSCHCRECLLDEVADYCLPEGAEVRHPRPRRTPRTPAAAPAKPRPRGWREPSEKQIELIGRLFDEREFRSPRSRQAFAEATYEEDFGSRDASAHIDTLMALPRAGTRERKARQAADNERMEAELEEGALYFHPSSAGEAEGLEFEVYRVQRSKSSGKLYALRVLEGGGTEYAPGVVTRLDPSRKLTLDEAQAWGRRTGTCCNCYRKLTNPESIEAGIGPICRAKGWG